MSALGVFAVAAAVAVLATLGVLLARNPVHALLHFVVSLLAVAVIFFLLGAPFVAALEVVVYAGAIMVLFVFAVMLLGDSTRDDLVARPRDLVGPALLASVLLGLLVERLTGAGAIGVRIAGTVGAEEVASALLGPYLLAVELASMLLLAGLVAAHHLARGLRQPSPREGSADARRRPVENASGGGGS